MSRNFLFSIVIPTYNREFLIPKSIESVLEQIFFDYELIIIDDGSTDNTETAIKKYLADSRIKYIKIRNSERGAARNLGVKNAVGNYVTFLDSDDIFLPWHLSTAFDKINELSNPPAFHLGYEILHSNGKINSLPFLPSPVNDKLLEGNFLSCMGVFLRRDIALSNPFDEDRDLSGSEDYECWLRLAAKVPIYAFPDVTSRLINHDNRSVITTDSEKLIKRITLLGYKLNEDADFLKRFGRNLKKFTSYRSLYLALHLALSGERWQAIRSLVYTFREYPYVVFNYRFAVALKKIVLW